MTESSRPERYSRLVLLLKEEGLDRLLHSRVMVLGLGGVGSSCCEALARAGVGSLVILDGDRVEESNINRQALAFLSTVGRLKVEVMGEMVKQINPDCELSRHPIFLEKETIEETLSSLPRPDYVVDCIDTISQKLGIAAWCAKEGLPLLSAMGAANKYDPCQLRFGKIEETVNCALSKVIRRECRKRGIRDLEVIYSTELVNLEKRDPVREKSRTLGSMSYMPPIMGQMMAGRLILRLAGLDGTRGIPHLAGRRES